MIPEMQRGRAAGSAQGVTGNLQTQTLMGDGQVSEYYLSISEPEGLMEPENGDPLPKS